MGYLSACRADSSITTCRSISSISPIQLSKSPEESSSSSFHKFNYKELQAATSNFSESTLLGRGSHGAVFKAVLKSGRQVAVKRPSRRLDEAENELVILSSVKSPRVVNLLGFASSTEFTPNILLVVEFMPNGTLYDLLHKNGKPPGWTRRMRVALQVAKAIMTLHSCDPPVIHRDVKAANVLLDQNLDAKLGDFGLAMRTKDGSGGLDKSTPPAGTLGYLDPAYVTPENLSTKTDVFSFGILLLEIMSGRKAIDVAHSPPSVVEWAVPMLRKGKVAAIFDPRIPPPRDPIARRQLAALAASCVRPNRERRPSMIEIVEQLKVFCRTVPASRAWNGIGNPCAVVETEKTISRVNSNLKSDLSENNGVRRESGKLKELMARIDLERAFNDRPAVGTSKIRTVPVLSVVKEVDEKNGEASKEEFDEKKETGLLRRKIKQKGKIVEKNSEDLVRKKDTLKGKVDEKSDAVLLRRNDAVLLRRNDAVKGKFNEKIEAVLLRKKDALKEKLDEQNEAVLLREKDAIKGELDEQNEAVLLRKSDALKGELDEKNGEGLLREKDGIKRKKSESLSKLDVLEKSSGKSDLQIGDIK